MADDAELLRRLRAGDERAFATLVNAYQPALIHVAESYVGNRAVAEEVVQDTWLAVVRGLDRFESRSTFKTWLFHILVNRARTVSGREHRCEPIGIDGREARFDHSVSWSPAAGADPDNTDDRLLAEQLVHRMYELLPMLGDVQRRVVVLHDVEGRSNNAIAALLGITAGYERVLLHRGRARIRHLLEEEMVGV